MTPSFEQAEFLEEAIRSILLQGYPNLEYTVVDGGSRDGSVAILERYDPWLSYWCSEPDDGQTDAIRKGFDRSTGEILAWLNSDDRLHPGVLFDVARQFQRRNTAGLIYGRSAFVDHRGAPLGDTAGRAFAMGEMLEGDNCVAQPSAFFSRGAYEAAGGLDPELHYVMDFDLWLRMALHSDVLFVDETWADFRLHPESKTGGGALRFDREIRGVLERAFASSNLPAATRSNRRRALAKITLRLAFRHYQTGDDAGARRYAAQAFVHNPAAVCGASARATLVRCLLGRRTVQRVKRIRGLPADA